MKIGGFDLSEDVLVVAEIGNNHEGDPDRALEMIDAAASAGAAAVKFQTFRTEHYVSPEEDARFLRLKGFELPHDSWIKLAERAAKHGLLFISTPFDLTSADLLEPLVDAFKVASGDLVFFPLIERLVQTGKPIIISTGAAEMEEVEQTVAFIQANGAEDRLAVLHCVAAYPAPPEAANLGVIESLARRWPDLPIGYSDHVIGLDAALASLYLGARVLEKHFTLDRESSNFVDHKIAADPAMLSILVREAKSGGVPAGDRRILGDGIKRLMACEEEVRPAIRRSIAAASNLPAGHTLSIDDLTWTRPSGGFPPGKENRLLGRRLRRALRTGETIRQDDLS